MVANVGLIKATSVLWDFYPYPSSGLPKLLANSATEEAVRLFLMPRWTGARSYGTLLDVEPYWKMQRLKYMTEKSCCLELSY